MERVFYPVKNRWKLSLFDTSALVGLSIIPEELLDVFVM